MQAIDEFYSDSKKYIEQFDVFIQKHGLTSVARADHICYKCESQSSFESLRALFEAHSDYIYQSIISGRRIAYIKLKKHIDTRIGKIMFLELSDQKSDGSQQGGFDHIEVYPVSIPYDEMIKQLEVSEKVIKVERPHHTTHDIDIGAGFLFRCTHEALIEKIKEKEMVY